MKPAKGDYKGRYNLKLETAKNKAEYLKESNSKEVLNEFKNRFTNKSFNYFIAYLNILNKEDIDNLEELIINEEDVLKQEKLIEYLSIMAKAKALEDKHMYKEAIEKYKETAEDENNPKRYATYNRMCICYRKINDYINEFSVVKMIVNDDSVPKDKKRRFKRRIERKLKNKETLESDILCPKCKEEYLKYKIHEPTNTKMYKCGNCKHVMID